MYAEERRRQIASLTAVEGRVNVTELSHRFEVTAETIRRDLAALDRDGVLQRVHGGAVPTHSYRTQEFSLDSRFRSATSAKNAIARVALRYLPGESGQVFLDSGSTINILATMIREEPVAPNLSFVTNSLPIALDLSSSDNLNVQLLGGTVRTISQAVVGDTALRTLALMKADVAFIGTSGLSVENGLSTADAQQSAVKASLVTNAEKVVVLCDSSKLGSDYLVSFAPLDLVDVVITDTHAAASIVSALTDRGIEVVQAR